MKIPELKQSGVLFDRDAHRYTLNGKELKGITSTFIRRINPHEYDTVDPEYLAKRAEYGTGVHDMIEFCITNGVDSDSVEWGMFKKIIKPLDVICIGIEYIVTDEEKYASPIDLVFLKKDGTILLIDIKTNYKPPIDKATAQLSWYKRRFEIMNPELKVSEVALLWLRDDEKRGPQSGYFPLTPWDDEMLDALISCYEEDKEFVPALYVSGGFPAIFAKVEEEVANIEKALADAKKRQEELRRGLLDKMVEYGIKSYTGSRIRLTRTLPYTKKKFDADGFKKDYPETYDEYCKDVENAGSLRITLL